METGSLLTPDRLRKAGAFTVVLVAHAGLFALMARTQAPPPMLTTPPFFEVQLFRPLPPPPPPPEAPSEDSGGGAPAAPSRIHVPPPPRTPVPPEVPAPPEQAPEPDIVVGAAPTASPTPGLGQGGEGTGTGTGTGAGSGPGSGSTRERFLRGPSGAERLRHRPLAAAARQGGSARLRCVIGLDSRLDACRVVEERPAGQGFGEAALATSVYFRFQPPTENGRAVEGREVTVGIDFPPMEGRRGR